MSASSYPDTKHNSKTTYETVLECITGALILAFPLFTAYIDHWASYIYTLLALTIFFMKPVPIRRHLTNEEKYFLWVILFFIVVFYLNYFLIDPGDYNFSRVRRYTRILPVIAILIVMARIRPREFWLWYGIIFAAIVSCIMGTYEWFIKPYPHYRLHGSTNPIVYGWINACLAMLSITSWSYFKNKSLWLRIMPFAGYIAAMSVCILSGSRGAWIAALIASIFYARIYWRHIRLRYKSLAIIIILASLTVVYWIPQTSVKFRMNNMFKQISLYISENKTDTSVGARFEMWRIATNIFLENPILGAGANEFNLRLNKKIESGQFPQSYSILHEPHNEYLYALSSRGILGFLSLVLLLIVPILHFRKYTRYQYDGARRFAEAGEIFILCYAIFGLTASMLDFWRSLIFFSFYLPILMGYMGNTLHSNNDDSGSLNSKRYL